MKQNIISISRLKTLGGCVLSTFIVFLLESCGNIDMDPRLLVVERQWEVIELDDRTMSVYGPTFCVDVPINGPKALTDSVMAFLNKEIYNCCELILDSNDRRSNSRKLAFKDVLTDNADSLVLHYVEAYKPYFKEELCNTYMFTLMLIAQTESFITYGLEFYHCGASCGSELRSFTFDKRDGHRIENIMSNRNLFRFLTDAPYYKDMVEEYCPAVTQEKDLEFADMDFALLGNMLNITFNGVVNHYRSLAVNYNVILPYLSEEARQLQSNKSVCDIEQWYIGCRIGSVKTFNGQSVYIIERSPHTPGNLMPEDVDWLYRSEASAYIRQDGEYKPIKVFDVDGKYVSSIKFDLPHPNGSRGVPYNESVFAFNQEKKELYVPYPGGFYQCLMHLYQFDGNHFVYTGRDVDFVTYSNNSLKTYKLHPLKQI